MVLDLTNSSRYYRFNSEVPDAEHKGICYRKVYIHTYVLQRVLCQTRSSRPQIPCRGRGQAPQPSAVNHAVWEICTSLTSSPQKFVLMHCTHGFNRTGGDRTTALCQHAYPLTLAACCYIGYIIACVLMRLLGASVERSLRSFAEGRLPGIYKDGEHSLCQ
jgi:hypothetical protein